MHETMESVSSANTKDMERRSSFQVGAKHARLMSTLAMLSLATSEQLNRALYSKGSLTTTERLLHELFQARYLDRLFWRRFERGNPKNVWKLAGRGMRYLKSHGLAPADLIRPSDNTSHTRLQLSHTMRAHALLVHGLELAHRDQSLSIALASEPTLRRHPLVVGTGLNQATVYPDAWMRLVKSRPHLPAGDAALAFELDRGTTDLERVKRKLGHWLEADGSEEYRALFGTDFLLVVWVVDQGNARRRDQLIRACWEVLQDRHEEGRADLFLFGATDDATSADTFFFDPAQFLRPAAQPVPVSLLPQSWRNAP